MWITVKCPDCNGSGQISPGYHFDAECKECSGTGTVLISEEEAKGLLLQKQIKDAEL